MEEPLAQIESAKATEPPQTVIETEIPPTLEILPTATATLQPATFFFFEEGVNPLTGLPVADPALLLRRPVMIKVSNWPRLGRPHAGLSSADIVFEYYIGHAMNRYSAIYYGDNAAVVGPLRSGRLVDAQLAILYHSFLAYGNADPTVETKLVEDLGERALAFKNLPCPPICGELTHSATGVFVDSAAVTDYVISKKLDNDPGDLRGMYFTADLPAANALGAFLGFEYANYSRAEWAFDSSTGLYNLSMDTETADGRVVIAPMTDRNDGSQIAFANVVVMFADYIEYASTLHDINLIGNPSYQAAMLFRDGMLIYGTWRVPYPDRPIIFETADGTPMPFKPGNTWIIIAGNHSSVSRLSGGDWEFVFGLP